MRIQLECGSECWNIDLLTRTAETVTDQEERARVAGLRVSPGEIACTAMEKRRCSDSCESGPRICEATAVLTTVSIEGQPDPAPGADAGLAVRDIEGFVLAKGSHQHSIPLETTNA